MRTQLMYRVHDHLLANHPDILLPLQEQHQLTLYLEAQVSAVDNLLQGLQEQQVPDYEIEGVCMQAIIDQLPPSAFNYCLPYPQ